MYTVICNNIGLKQETSFEISYQCVQKSNKALGTCNSIFGCNIPTTGNQREKDLAVEIQPIKERQP